MIVFGSFTGYTLWTVVIRLHIYFTDWFFGELGLELGLGVLVFEITKTTTPKLAVTFDLKLGGKDRTKDNLTDYTYFSYKTLYFDGFDFRGSYFKIQNLKFKINNNILFQNYIKQE